MSSDCAVGALCGSRLQRLPPVLCLVPWSCRRVASTPVDACIESTRPPSGLRGARARLPPCCAQGPAVPFVACSRLFCIRARGRRRARAACAPLGRPQGGCPVRPRPASPDDAVVVDVCLCVQRLACLGLHPRWCGPAGPHQPPARLLAWQPRSPPNLPLPDSPLPSQLCQIGRERQREPPSGTQPVPLLSWTWGSKQIKDGAQQRPAQFSGLYGVTPCPCVVTSSITSIMPSCPVMGSPDALLCAGVPRNAPG
jgi:hypothetical protein